jgi:hypothetical protein
MVARTRRSGSGLRNLQRPYAIDGFQRPTPLLRSVDAKRRIERLAERLGEDAYSAEVIPAGHSGERRPSLGVGMVGSRAGA